jgi:transcriptional regulator with XRE-family HTH domain
MVTRPRGRPQLRSHLYIAEWMEHRGLGDDKIAAAIGVARETVTRWRNQQHRLNPDKIAQLAEALNIEPAQLWRPPSPGRPSVDSMLRDAPDETVQRAAEALAILLKTAR